MVSWKSVRLIILTLIFMGVVIVIGIIQLLDLSPRSLLAVLYSPRAVLTGSATNSPASTPSSRTFEGTPPVVPRYPSVTIMTPEASIFAAGTNGESPIARASGVDAADILGGGNCLQNEDNIPTLLPDCVMNEQGQIVPSQE